MVEMARQARLQNIPIKVLVERSLNNKKLSSEEHYCENGQLEDHVYEQFFSELEMTIALKENMTSYQNVDFHSGAEIYLTMIFCPNPTSLKLFSFFEGIIDSQKPGAMIRTVVDIIQSEIVDNTDSQKSLNELYLALEKEYDLQYGKILLALLSKKQLEDIMGKGWPFFLKYSQEVDLCLNGTACDSLDDIIATLGKTMS